MLEDNDYRRLANIIDNYKDKENVMLCEFFLFLKEKKIKLEELFKEVEKQQDALLTLLLTPIIELIQKRFESNMKLLSILGEKIDLGEDLNE